ncbi:antitoxin Xre/MbcA/ParS toxin-binding domain-containing protein [Escherichia coli]|uniref:antitoxin Xre/MbcA/ParS toxin-binding domain-containing protein n=1 Tax=Escherichia coli TaxID=562 RepID=UPI001CDBD17A|nr:antitoxin Xre/MbcA/ParS toxin-binding domain-containing protein [Escherichia coli]
MLTKNDVIQKAIDLFEGNESAELNWCNEPNRALQWKASSEIMDSEEGALKVAILIFRIDQGVYS